MSFQSFSFLAFLVVTVVICLVTGKENRRTGMLLLTAASVVFCLLGHQGVRSFWVLILGCLVTEVAMHRMTGRNRRTVLILACIYHVAVLMVFKYTGFFTGGAMSIGWVPIGLSFFTFQQLWLLKEVYTGQFRPDSGEEILLHALFFPVVISGPILRPGSFYPQLKGEGFLRPGEKDIAAGLYAICLGTAKKVLLADQLGVVVANGWAVVADLTAPAAWVTMLAYTLQLYLDFSGYCDIAAGCARLLGIRLSVNFNSPYRSLSVGEFWKRWHITLTTFLRECVYFPLGGSRKGSARTCINILLVFLISGLWHGNGWTFVVWGLLHGLAQVDERLFGARLERLAGALRWALTMFFLNFAWVFFRAPDMTSAISLLSAAVSGGGVGVFALSAGVFESEMNAVTTILPGLTGVVSALLPPVLIAAGAVVSLWPRNTIQKMEDFRPTAISAAVLAVLALWAVLSFSGVTTFIYSNF